MKYNKNKTSVNSMKYSIDTSNDAHLTYDTISVAAIHAYTRLYRAYWVPRINTADMLYDLPRWINKDVFKGILDANRRGYAAWDRITAKINSLKSVF